MTLLIMAIPIVNVIALFYWAFSEAALPSKRTWAQAHLVIFAVGLGLFLIAAPFTAILYRF